MRKLFRVVLASMAVAAALTGCGGKKSEAPADGGTKKETAKAADAIEIKVATVGNEKHQSTIAATYFKEKIEELSGGQVKVTIYPNASLGSGDDNCDDRRNAPVLGVGCTAFIDSVSV